MREESLGSLLEFAVEVAWRAGRCTLAHFQADVTVEEKGDGTPVTVADREAERVARELIGSRFPEDGLLGEEFGEERPDARRRWILDPIDGTASFIRGVPLYGVLVALEQDGEPVLGVIHLPALGETVYAARGEGCWWDGRRARVSPRKRLDEALVLCTDPREAAEALPDGSWEALARRARRIRTWGDCYGYALVATGRAEAMLDPVLAAWDAAPLLPIVEEAGGAFTDWRGARTHRGGSAIATNAELAVELRSLLARGEGAP